MTTAINTAATSERELTEAELETVTGAMLGLGGQLCKRTKGNSRHLKPSKKHCSKRAEFNHQRGSRAASGGGAVRIYGTRRVPSKCALSPVMAITKYRIWAHAVSRFTVTPRAFSQCGRAAWMEKIMTKTTHKPEVTELSLEELESVGGGIELVHEPLHVANKTECWFYSDIITTALINGHVK